ncbi:hypothetical protein P6U16_22135 (plasmid) [Rhizobium sp. 32-5/1]|uniref:hypothetical protein n=1 Tax=Rhizobium sp. 32-5/1 TaxID=3019602 RepID=UPI00240D08DF|nr:hypothetical protein [Rhizobium sp. 32-5/1]WEZ85751.1 hypothetical protein P6U16_22135 [Rhizobium sp. 32-5/1]
MFEILACSPTLGGIELETAHGKFAAFAETHDLLVSETNVLAGSRPRRDRDPQVR